MTSATAMQEMYRLGQQLMADFQHERDESERRRSEIYNRFMARLQECINRGNRVVDPIARNSPEEIRGLSTSDSSHDDDSRHSQISRSRRRWHAVIIAITFICTRRGAVATVLLRDRVQNTTLPDESLFRDDSDQLQRFDFHFPTSEWSNVACRFERTVNERAVRGKVFRLVANSSC